MSHSHRSTVQISNHPHSSSMAEPNSKLKGIISSHEHMKFAFLQLKSQIKIGLIEAEDVFASLSLPLMKLVGLKTVEMAQEGRFNTIVTEPADCDSEVCHTSTLESETRGRWTSAVNEDDQVNSYATKATMVVKELKEKQRKQLTQLIHLLRQIENQVNISHTNIIQNLRYQRGFLYKFFQKAISHISSLHHPTHNQDTFNITLKLLHMTFEQVIAALGSVENGVEGLMQELADQMCSPMVDYVNSLKVEMKNGPGQHLLAMLDEMSEVMRDGRSEVEEARKRVKVAEEKKVMALSRLTESEEIVKRMKEYLGFLLEEKKRSENSFESHQFRLQENHQEKDEKGIWELLKKKRKYRISDSLMRGNGTLYGAPNNKIWASPMETIPSITTHRPVNRSHSQKLAQHTPRCDIWLPLGLSPSASSQQLMSRRRITP